MTEEPPAQQPPRADKRLNKESIIGLWPAGLAIALVLLITHLYVGVEAPCYWSDFNYYEWASRFSINQLMASPLTYPILLLSSVNLQHNLYITVPLVPLMAVLGASRFAYVASTAICFMLPLAYLIALIAKTIELKPGMGLGKSFLLILLMPVLWAPSLRGYPDIGAACTLLLALLIYLKNPQFKNVKQGATIGFLLALTVLLRRYFAFAGVALLGTITIVQLALYARHRRERLQSHDHENSTNNEVQSETYSIVGQLKTLAALIGAGATTMICLGFPFLQNLTRLNFGALYESYHVSAAASLAYFFSCFGLITLLISASGFVIAWRNGLVKRSKTLFVLCFGIMTQCLWIVGPSELGTHYTLYFSPLVALGVVLFFNGLLALSISKGQKNTLVLSTLMLLALNFGLSLAPAALVHKCGLTLFRPGMLSYPDQEGSGAAVFFSAGYAPNVRGDLGALKAIVNLLRPHYADTKTTGPAEAGDATLRGGPLLRRGQVSVAASSKVLNSESLRNVERSMYGLNEDKIPWLELPVVNSKDSYPLERLLACQYVLVPSTNQYFIPPAGQTILASVKACFDQKWPLADDFRALPVTYVLDGGLKVTVFERIRATSPATAALTLDKIKAFAAVEPGSQPLWLTTGQMSQICYDKKRDSWQFKPGIYRPGFFGEESSYLVYAGTLPASFTLSGQLTGSAEAQPGKLRARLLGEDGQLVEEVDMAVTAAGQTTEPVKRDYDPLMSKVDCKTVSFKHDFNRQAKYLVLLTDTAPQAGTPGATLTLNDLKLLPMTSLNTQP